MSKFSRKYGYDNKTTNEIIEDAPTWTRIGFIDGILKDLVYVDQDSRYKNIDGRPIGIKALHKEFAFSCRIQLEVADYDSWYCEERLYDQIKAVSWYYFYDLVEMIGKKLKEIEGEYLFEEEKRKTYGYANYKKKINELFVNDRIVWQLNDDSELTKSIPEVLQNVINKTEKELINNLNPARIHYKKAYKYLFSFPIDTENGIKEIVSAIESIGRIIYPKASTLGDVIKEIRKEKLLPEMLLPIMEKYYAFANATPAVRHGSNKTSNLETTDGEFVFYVGVALIRYLIKVNKDKNLIQEN